MNGLWLTTLVNLDRQKKRGHVIQVMLLYFIIAKTIFLKWSIILAKPTQYETFIFNAGPSPGKTKKVAFVIPTLSTT